MWRYVLKVWLTTLLGGTVIWWFAYGGLSDWRGMCFILVVVAVFSTPAALLSTLAVWIIRDIDWTVLTSKIVLSLIAVLLIIASMQVIFGRLNEGPPILAIFGIPAVAGIIVFRWPKPARSIT